MNEALIIKSAQLSEKAREISKQCSLWLEHPYCAHAAHEAAASAAEQIGDTARAIEHRRAAQNWANKELEENSRRYKTRTN